MTVVLAAVSESRPDRRVDDLWSRLDPEFLTTAGWDPQTETLAPQPDHPLLGSRRCRVQGCQHQPEPPDGLCPTCGSAYRLSGMSVEEFLSLRQVRKVQRGEVNCSVRGCSRPCRNNRMTLCPAHDEHRKRLNLSPIEFVNHPAARALPGMGPCSVPMCDRQAKYRRGMCGSHYARWWDQRRKGLDVDFEAWCRRASPILDGHGVALHGLTSQLQAEILFGLQHRCRRSVITYLYQLRLFVGHLRTADAATIVGFDVEGLPKYVRPMVQELQSAVSRSAPEAEQHKDIWDMAVFGHGRKRMDFTVIAQPWLRNAAKHWVLEELPVRRGPNVVNGLRDHVNSVGELGNSLRLHRADEGMNVAVLDRADIVAFLNRLKHQETTGVISAYRRRKIAGHAALVLRECRAIGLTRPDRPMAGLSPEFTFRRNDVPPVPKEDGPGRALPDSVLTALVAALDRLEAAAGRDVSVAVRLLIDTGRRPTEICKLPWDCVEQDRDGKYALIYTDFKNNRAGRRLAISDATAALIVEQKQRVRQRFPDTAPADLVLLPRVYRNPHGTQSLSDNAVARAHRDWVDSLAPLQHPDQTEFDKSAVFLYAYRHIVPA